MRGVSSYTFKWWLKEHPIWSSGGVDTQTPQTAVLKHPIFNSEETASKVSLVTKKDDAGQVHLLLSLLGKPWERWVHNLLLQFLLNMQ